MKTTGILWLLFGLVLWSSCRTDFDTVISTGNLEFSRDTVYLDTVFSNIGSSTYSLKVYNRGNEDLTIPRVELRLEEESGYRLNVDGIPGKSFENVDILAKDSIYIFIETTVDYAELTAPGSQFLYVDAIEFSSASHSQQVALVTLIKDAIFLYPRQNSDGTYENISFPGDTGEEKQIRGFYLEEDELEFTSEKPYVIYGYAAVPPGKALNIAAGARIHFHADSGLLVSAGASIRSNGAFSENRNLLEREVIFEGDRLETRFSEIPGQWGSIWLTAGSVGNSFDFTTIKNATVGILADPHTEVLIRNSQIYNSASNGILARNAQIEGENLVINNSGQNSLQLVHGGNYSFKHSTFANYWQLGLRQFPAVFLSNTGNSGNAQTVAAFNAGFSNCIIYGNQSTELGYSVNETADFNVRMLNTLIRFAGGANSSGNALYDFSNSEYYDGVIFNEDPQFMAPGKNELQLTEESPARNRGDLFTARAVPVDLLQNNRTTSPDLGAYEWVPPAEQDEEN